MPVRRLFHYFPACLLIIGFCTSCASYYQSNQEFNTHFEQGNFEEAEQDLTKDKKAETRKTRLLYYLNRGTVASIQGKYAESNAFFERAYQLGEDYRKNYVNEVASFLLNPTIVEYPGEDFELLLVHYYKALNFLRMGDRESALVECRRMNIKLNQVNSKYTSENKYKRDAFIQNLMGLVYDANGEDNNAFIAYRNAYEIYQQDYKRLFNLDAPEQLKKDLLRSAWRNNFPEELRLYEKEFGMKYEPGKEKTGEVVFLWHNGLGPVKVETGITFGIVRNHQLQQIGFTNSDLGLNYTFPMDDSTYHKSGLSDLEFFRITFPKYIERPAYYQSAQLQWQNQSFPLQLAEDVNGIAFKTLNQRMLLEVGKSVLRVAIKKAAEYQLRKKNDNAGALLGLFNALSEQADTRSWQTVPHAIHYARLSLPAGSQPVKLNAQPPNGQALNQEFTFDIQAGNTAFYTFHSLEKTTAPYGQAY